MITFRRTKDSAAIKAVLTHHRVYPHVGDDLSPHWKQFQPNDDERIHYLEVLEFGQSVGLITFLPRSAVLWEVHLALLPNRRTHGTAILAKGIAWLFRWTGAQRIVAEVPVCNRLAVQLAGKVMQRFGTNEKAFLKHGILHDLALFGISKEPSCPAS